jgi:O-antigen/teichoic acid export membrane protein
MLKTGGLTPVRVNFFWKMGGAFLGGGTNFIFSILVIRYLGPEGYGRYAFALGFAGLFSILIDYGFNAVITRDLAQDPGQGRSYFRRILAMKGGLFLASGVLLAVSSFFYPPAKDHPFLLASAFLFLAGVSFSETAQAFSYAYERFRAGLCLTVTHKWLVVIGGLAAMWAGGKSSGILAAMALAGFAGIFPSFFYFNRLFSASSRGSSVPIRGVVRDALPLFIQNVLIVICVRTDTVLLASLRGAEETGLYSAAYRFFEVANIVPTAFAAAVSAPLSRSVLTGEWKERFLRYAFYAFVLGVGGLLSLQAVSFALPRYFLSDQYAASAPILRLFSLSLPFLFLNYLMTTMLTMLRRQTASAWVSAGGAVFNLLVNLWAIPRWGVTGATLTTVFTQVAVFFSGLLCLNAARRAATA